MPPATPPSSSSVIVEIAGPRAIAKCRVCSKQIDPNNVRIGVKVWMGGHSTVVWQKAASFLEWGCGLEYAKTGAASCKITGKKISKDALRFKIHNGPPPAAYYVSFDASAELNVCRGEDRLCLFDAHVSVAPLAWLMFLSFKCYLSPHVVIFSEHT